ncbi:oligosaccharide repeat unit polymerase [Lihuaxuella thermophila]|uniref:Oligosaccharide repeat unit polymerase n=1 Tax=Lihuaxuella thermophila TaxID=1173111 RepID=A0A1H8G4T3_9BACL|nr:oligosaccharide repeat unit polymerase [Lihuaxuella thermophila]SEN38308.1 oligosaccharide repeat unit polymerase [Lihuaxuella thermophila]
MVYIVIWLIVLAASVFLFQQASGRLSLVRPNLHSLIFYYSLLLSSFIGSLLIVLNIDHSYIIVKLIFQEKSRQIGFSLVCIVMVLLPLTMFVISKLSGFHPRHEFDRYWNSPVVESLSKREQDTFYRIFFALSVICLGSILYTFLRIEHVPIFEAFLNPDANLSELRIEAKEGFKGISAYLRNIFAIGLTPILSLIAYAYKVKTKEPKWAILFAVLFAASVLINIYDFQKSPVIFYIASFILLRMYLGKTKMSLKKFLVFVVLAFSYLLVMYASLGVKDAKEYLSYSSGPIGRIILTQIAPMYAYVDRYDEVYPFLEERGLPQALLELYHIDQVRSSRVLMEDLFPERIEAGTAGVLNTLYVGEAYATYGVPGVILGTIMIGVFIQLLYMVFLRLPKHPVFLSLFIYFMINIPRALVGGFSDLILNPVWFMLSAIVVSSYVFVQLRHRFIGYLGYRKERNT